MKGKTKILHCCLANFYIDNFGYQENILPKHHRLEGLEVRIVASTETYMANKTIGYVKPRSYLTPEGIPINRIPYSSILPHSIMRKLRIYKGLRKEMENYKPDIIFLHDCMFMSIIEVVRYAKANPAVKIYVDCHTDFVNSARTWTSKNVLHRLIYKRCAKLIEKYAVKFYGTLPARNEFLEKFYEIDGRKIELLPFGIDDSIFEWDDRADLRSEIRRKLDLGDDDFVFITGGKIDERKNIHFLLEAFSKLDHSVLNRNVKLIAFGKPTHDMQQLLAVYRKFSNIIFIDWIPANEIYKYFFAADIGVFPGTHSTLWEEAVGSGLPCLFKKWEGIQHVNLGGNCMFIEKGTDITELQNLLSVVSNDFDLYNNLNNVAKDLGPKTFVYSQIAKQSIS